ncbi:acetylglutamate kinase [Helicobacter cholecystus]|uniref:Acetylglutamate kinase n=1 Tax=Helicobacter cholecystus TaxID=45498 RepID=A0A3D8IT41_9HELI|nr:acetylglutamate kinase [Helicobacter cholecystus]RDU68150.1 acetylglutamate kinase [Helicobacter cholecystus]VEJ24520.1 acetylglutamate kinase [Helicobacter cholecystus]
MNNNFQRAQILLEALPFIKIFRGSKIVIKYGGSAQIDPKLREQFAKDIVMMYMLGIQPIIVHGGGKRITSVLESMGVKSEFVNGCRITTQECIEVVEMVLSGEINKELAYFLSLNGVRAVGISGKDASLLNARVKDNGKYGFTGEIISCDPSILHSLLQEGVIPVISPISGDAEGRSYNVNADEAACEIAKALKADKVIFLTDTLGVLGAQGELLESIKISEVSLLIQNGVISGGMIPKIEACVDCLNSGVKKVHIIDGRVEHSLLLELFTNDGVGSEIVC